MGTEEIPAKRWALKSSITGESSPRGARVFKVQGSGSVWDAKLING